MNNAYVYKRHSLISENVCVRIPDGSNGHDVVNPKAMPAIKKEAPSKLCSDESKEAGIIPSVEEMTDTNLDISDTVASEASEVQTKLQKQKKKASQKSTDESPQNTRSLKGKETLLRVYKNELEELAQSVAESAYFDALNKKKCELKECIYDVQRLLDELTRKHEEFIEQYTDELKYMAVDIAEKMILEKISLDDAILQKLVLQNIKAVKSAEWISVELSERLVGLVDFVKKELDMQEYKGRTNVITVPDKPDVCRITTEEGTIVSTISVQANNLRKVFREADQQ